MGDFNGDGKTDLATANYGSNTVSILFGTPVQHQVSVGVTSSVGVSTYGQALTLTATVSAAAPASGTPTGTVTFYDGATPLSAPVTLADGTANFTTSALNAGTHTITALYSGDNDFNGNTGAMFQTVNKAVPAFSALSPPTISYGTPTTTLSGSISLVPDGETVSITLGGVTHTATVMGGAFSSVFTTSALAISGSPYTITCAYAGDANLMATTDTSHTLRVVLPGGIQGTLWNDANGDGVEQAGEAPLVGRKVYVDTNHDGHWDTGEPYALTNADGNYTITGVTPGTYSLQEALPSGWEQTSPSLGSAPRRLFALTNDGSGQIVELDPANGAELERFATPDGSSWGGTLAYDGTRLFYLNQNEVWQLNPDTGAVVRSDWIGVGGGFQGTAALDGELYLLSWNQSVVEFDPGMHLVTQVLTLSWPSLNEPPRLGSSSQGGDLTAITSPDALLVTGMWADPTSGQWEQGVLQIDPATGVVSPLFAYPAAVTTGSPYPQSLAVVEGSIYAGVNQAPFGMTAPLYVLSRSGTLEQTIPLSYGVNALGGDDVAADPAGYTVTVASGAVSQGSNFGSRLAVGEIQGTLWNDVNGNGVQDPGELPLAGRMVYVDTNHDGHWDTGEPYGADERRRQLHDHGRDAGDVQPAGGVAVGLGADEPERGQRAAAAVCGGQRWFGADCRVGPGQRGGTGAICDARRFIVGRHVGLRRHEVVLPEPERGLAA